MLLREKRHVSTTTWPDRHEGTFRELGNCLNRFGISSPTVLEVGPGATTTLLRNQLASGEGQNLSWLANHYRAVLRNLDGLLRRIPNMPLCSYEPGELQEFLPAGAKLIVTDISPAVIAAIQKQYPRVEANVFDFSINAYPVPVDVIVCLCVLVRAQEPKKIWVNLYRSLKAGGLLVMDNRSCTTFGDPDLPLKKMSSQIWQKSDNTKREGVM
ncbi:MAG: class I SAM-dependent methyltransferase [Phycisphaerae bacterium]